MALVIFLLYTLLRNKMNCFAEWRGRSTAVHIGVTPIDGSLLQHMAYIYNIYECALPICIGAKVDFLFIPNKHTN